MKNISIIMLLIIFFTFVSAQDSEIEVNPPIIKAVIGEGNSVSNPVSILNAGESQSFSISYFSANNFIIIDESELEFVLGKGEGKSIDVILNGKFLGSGVYPGEILFKGKDNLVVPAILEVETFSPLFDLSIEIPESSLKISEGSDFVTEITVYKLKGESSNAILNYYISDTKGNVIVSESQDVKVDKQLKLTKTFPLPPATATGNYVFYATAKDVGYISTGTSSLLFYIFLPEVDLGSPSSKKDDGYFLIASFIIIVVLIVSFLIFNHFWSNRLVNEAKNWNEKLNDIEKMKFSDSAKKINKLKYQRDILEKAYAKGYIKNKSYEEGKRKINDIIDGLKKRL